jgi:pimeloyl-ACP methyl ester carboxylesterase
MSKNTNPKTVVFVTGAFVTHLGWNEWRNYFESKGYKTVAPSWPYKEGTPAELRSKHPLGNPGLANLSLAELVDHYANIVKSFPEKPIVIGHSLGGLITQIILNRDLAAAAVAIHPVPPQGVFPYEFSFLKAGWRVLGLFTSLKKTYLMSPEKWKYAFTNQMTAAEQQKTWEENVVPESKKTARGGLSSQAKVDFKKPHAPLLITSGDLDNIMPAHLNRRNFNAYKKRTDSVLEYKEFKGRNHFVLGLPTWKEDADYILDWLDRQFVPGNSFLSGSNNVQKTAGIIG